jgi:hypothetical protein
LVSLRPQLSNLLGMDTLPYDQSPPGQNLTIQRPRLHVSEIEVTASIPSGHTLLVSGLRGYAWIGRHDKPKREPQWILMLVTPTIRQVPRGTGGASIRGD